MRPDASRTRRPVLALIVTVLLTVGGVLWVTHAGRVARAEVREWRAVYSEAKVVGKTADEITGAFGKPYAAERGPDGTPVLILYKQVGHGQYCGIALKDGIAVNVSFSFQ